VTAIFFWIFAALLTVTGLLAITRRNGVSAALWAAVTFVAIAGIFVLLQAYFLAVVEVLVYAGAIMVLFLFVIMLINLREEDLQVLEGPRLNVFNALLAAGFLGGLVWTCRRAGLYDIEIGTKAAQTADAAREAAASAADAAPLAGETKNVAGPLFLEYVLPFEIASFLLLAAIVGAVLITKKRMT